VHNKKELIYAVEIGAEIIGINNRNLNTFDEDINVCLTLARDIPKDIISIAESAIKTPEDIKRINDAGFNAVLIGETLVRSDNPEATLRHLRLKL